MTESSLPTRPLFERLQELGFRARAAGYLTWEDVHELLPTPLEKGEMPVIMKFLGELGVRILPKSAIRKPWSECVTRELLDEQNARYEAMDERVRAAIPGELRVKYSVYEWDENYLPIDNLDRIAERGRIYFEEDPTEDKSEPKPIWRSDYLESPTWMQLTILANEMMISCDYREHVYLEGVYEIAEEADGTRRLCFVLGS